jgi:predicted nucleic acid-binding protein
MPKIRVLLDACVLLPYQLADLLLRLADAEMYEPLWSEEILDEVARNLVGRFGVEPDKALRRLSHMRTAFPNAVVEGHEPLIPAMTNDPKDRHVAAAAVRGNAALIVTANLRDFPPESLSQYDIEAIHPDDFLLDQLDLSPDATIATVVAHRESYARPPYSVTEYYLSLRDTVPRFADAAATAEAAAWDRNDPLPLEIVPEAEAALAFFPDGPPAPTDPLGAAYIWWSALLDRAQYFPLLCSVTLNPVPWCDFQAAFDLLSNAAIAQFTDPCPGDEGIVFVKFLPNVGGAAMRSFGYAPLARACILTMVRCSDGWWRVWGLRENYFPTSEEVRSAWNS